MIRPIIRDEQTDQQPGKQTVGKEAGPGLRQDGALRGRKNGEGRQGLLN